MRIHIESSTSYRGRNWRPNWLALIGFIGLALAAGAVGALVSPGVAPQAGAWYAGLAKPAWAPPNTWFAPTWTVLYVLMGTSAWLIWHERYHRNRGAALLAYAVQLLLNATWAPAFFGARNVGAGLFVEIALWLAIVWTLREFSRVRPLAAVLLVPYLAWVSFAMALNFSIWRQNP
jgi:tryptophan-rich sensory protein